MLHSERGDSNTSRFSLYAMLSYGCHQFNLMQQMRFRNNNDRERRMECDSKVELNSKKNSLKITTRGIECA